jgi:tRNA dimethylallyltransferase
MSSSKLIAIVGCTASGKTALGIEIAKRIGGEVISVDSRMVYRGMNIGTAKPEGVIGGVTRPREIDVLFGGGKPLLVEGVPHWGIDLVDPDEEYSVAQFKEYAEKKIAEILARRHVPILVGGTGFWLSAVIDHLDLSSTPSDEKLRAQLEQKSLVDLFHEYKKRDPIGAEIIDRDNKRRVLRALEVSILTGKPFSQLQTRGPSKYDCLQIGIAVDREILNERINDRVDEMIARGLVNEVRSLKEKYGCTIESMTGIGYRQVCEFLEGRSTLIDVIEEIKKATRRYAKRQMTWFKRDERIHWVKNQKEAIESGLSAL